jgi:uncharacterized protein YraI
MFDDPEVSLDGANSTETTDKMTPHSPKTSGVAPDQLPTKRLQGCPYLGIVDDPDTRYLFASPIGCCYRATPEALVRLEQQQAFCLTEAYVDCPVFKQAQAGPLPEELGVYPKKQRFLAGNRVVGWGVVALLLLTTAVFLIFFRPNNSATTGNAAPALVAIQTETPTATATPSATSTATPQPSPTTPPSPTTTPTETATATATAVASPTATATASPTATFTPSPTATPAVIALVNVPRLNVRQGPGQNFEIIGVVENGDTLTVVGQSANDVGWWQVCCVAGEPGWVFGESILIEGDTSNIPLVSPPP